MSASGLVLIVFLECVVDLISAVVIVALVVVVTVVVEDVERASTKKYFLFNQRPNMNQ